MIYDTRTKNERGNFRSLLVTVEKSPSYWFPHGIPNLTNEGVRIPCSVGILCVYNYIYIHSSGSELYALKYDHTNQQFKWESSGCNNHQLPANLMSSVDGVKLLITRYSYQTKVQVSSK